MAARFDISRCLEVEHDSDKVCLKICDPTLGPAKYYDATFNDEYREYLIAKFENEDYLTDMRNHCQAINAMNVLYLDIDYKMNKEYPDERLANLDEHIANLYLQTFTEIAGFTDEDIKTTFVFIPDKYILDGELKKCGAHIFIYLAENISKNRRMEIYGKTKENILGKAAAFFEHINLNETTYEKIFDPQPLRTCSTLLPFATKVGAKRNYKLINYSLCDVDAFEILPTIHIQHDETIEEEEEEEFEPFVMEEYEETNSTVFTRTLEFISSLRYLCSNHQFWKVISEHELREKKIIKPVFHWLMLSQFVQDSFRVNQTKSISRTIDKLANAIYPLIVMTNEETVENKLEKVRQHIYGVCSLPYSREGAYRLLVDKEFSDAAFKIKNCPDAMVSTKMKSHVSAKYSFLDSDEKERKVNSLTNGLLQIRRFSKTIYSKFSKFVRLVMDSMEEEIRPFVNMITDKEILREGLRYTYNYRSEYSFDKHLMHPEKYHVYNNVIKSWLRMFICVMYYNLNAENSDAIRKSISCFVSHFTYKTKSGDEEITYIYNTRQTEDLFKYPYNQWIIDKGSSLIKNWFVYIYQTFIDGELQNQKKIKFIDGFIDMLKTIQPFEIKSTATITPLTNIDSDIEKIKNNVLLSSENKKNKPTKLNIVGDSVYFPMRNGILEFVTQESEKQSRIILMNKHAGDVVFHHYNFDKYMDAYTNVYYDENYNYSNPIYKIVDEVFKQIYENEEVREYVLTMFAQTLHSYGARDQIHQFYGTGSEGKSLINNAISSMLGCGQNIIISTKHSNNYKYDITNICKEMRIPFGLATTIDAKTVMTESKSTHDTGGVVELENKRFASVAEPNTHNYGTDLNVSTCKRIIGDSTISGRKIYKESIVFSPKVYITIQTNEVLGYSEDNDAVARRFGVILHESKFITSALTRVEKVNRKIRSKSYPVNSELSEHFAYDPAYWEALFRILLPYAQKFIRDRKKGLSDVKKPEHLEELFKHSRLRSNGLVGWLAKNYIEKPYAVRSVANIIKFIIDTDIATSNASGDSIMDASMKKLPREQKNIGIANCLTTRFGSMDKIFKLRDEFWDGDKIKTENVEIDGREVNVSDIKEIKTDEDIDFWFDPKPVKTLSLISDFRGAFIIDYDFYIEHR